MLIKQECVTVMQDLFKDGEELTGDTAGAVFSYFISFPILIAAIPHSISFAP